MTPLLTQASNGSRVALEALCEKSEKTVWFFCKLLSEKGEEAEKTFELVFNRLTDSVLKGEISDEQEFEKKAMRITAAECRKAMLASDPQSLKIPQNRNFAVDVVPDTNLPASISAITCLPKLQRYLFVMRRVAGMNDSDIAKVAKTDDGTMRIAFRAERANLERFLAEYCRARGGNAPKTAKEYMEALGREIAESEVPAEPKMRVLSDIAEKTAPLERERRRSKSRKIFGIIVSVIVIAGIAAGGVIALKRLKPNDSPSASASSGSAVSGVEDITPTAYADITVKDYGTITVALDGNLAPKTVENFTELAEKGFYNGLTFHRIIDGFMMQGGDPSGDGTGGSENTVTGEFSANGFSNPISHTRGAISMARSSDYNSASSQFFIVQSDSTQLDGQYAAFGYVTEGMDIVDSICKAADPNASNGLQKKEDQPVIESVTVKPFKDGK